jgi:hypothetical protein
MVIVDAEPPLEVEGGEVAPEDGATEGWSLPSDGEVPGFSPTDGVDVGEPVAEGDVVVPLGPVDGSVRRRW